MTERKKPKTDPRLGPLAAILELRYGELWRSVVPEATKDTPREIAKATLYSVFAQTRPLTEAFYGKMIAVIDAEISAMQENVKKAKALRAKLK